MNPKFLYHGTDQKSINDIIQNGVNIDKSTKGYFGKGFYTATNESLAKSNYADFAEEEDGEPGSVLKFSLNSNAKILDLDIPDDFEEWKKGKYEDLTHRDDFNKTMTNAGIDGLRDEGSFGGVVIYNPKVIKLIKTNDLKNASSKSLPEEIKQFEKELSKELGLKSLFMYVSGSDLTLETIIVDKASQGQGVGTKAMEKIIDFADQHGMRIILTTGTKDQHLGTTSSSRLKKFYKRFGFVENKGRNKDFSISKNMYKTPNSKTASEKKEITLYHGTTMDKAKQIKTKGLKSLMPHDARWYMLSTDFDDASSFTYGEKAVVEIILTLEDNDHWSGYPYLWPVTEGDNTSSYKGDFYAIKKVIPSKFIKKIIPIKTINKIARILYITEAMS